jgi:hypothetical protein
MYLGSNVSYLELAVGRRVGCKAAREQLCGILEE